MAQAVSFAAGILMADHTEDPNRAQHYSGPVVRKQALEAIPVWSAVAVDLTTPHSVVLADETTEETFAGICVGVHLPIGHDDYGRSVEAGEWALVALPPCELPMIAEVQLATPGIALGLSATPGQVGPLGINLVRLGVNLEAAEAGEMVKVLYR
jgi:hypothetical protein